jgi:UDP-N-acetyl-D-glucosamine dehydrogenase
MSEAAEVNQLAQSSYLQILLEKIEQKTAMICVVGLGYVGLPLSLRFAELGFRVLGLDNDAEKVNCLLSGKTYIKHISSDKIAEVRGHHFIPSTDFSSAKEADVIILCLPTPLNQYREPDLSYITTTMKALQPHLRPGQALSLESTTYPGTTEEVIVPFVDDAGLQTGKDFFVLYSPEREDPANKFFQTNTIPKITSGITHACAKIAKALYETIIEQVVPVNSTKVAEMAKLLENIHRAVNIGLVNEMKILSDRMGIDIYDVIEAAKTKPFGFTAYYPGPGLGGHCIPVDPFYLTWKAREYGLHTRFIELAGEINGNMPEWVCNKVMNAMNEHAKTIKGSNILVLGVAYKPNVDDMRESPSLDIMQRLINMGATINYHDPFVPSLPHLRHYDFHMNSVGLSSEALSNYDCVVLATHHSNVDYKFIAEHARLIIDTRGVYRGQQLDNVVAA